MLKLNKRGVAIRMSWYAFFGKKIVGGDVYSGLESISIVFLTGPGQILLMTIDKNRVVLTLSRRDEEGMSKLLRLFNQHFIRHNRIKTVAWNYFLLLVIVNQ